MAYYHGQLIAAPRRAGRTMTTVLNWLWRGAAALALAVGLLPGARPRR
jgi:hypothetical protein